jgi:hypothetical protein
MVIANLPFVVMVDSSCEEQGRPDIFRSCEYEGNAWSRMLVG